MIVHSSRGLWTAILLGGLLTILVGLNFWIPARGVETMSPAPFIISTCDFKVYPIDLTLTDSATGQPLANALVKINNAHYERWHCAAGGNFEVAHFLSDETGQIRGVIRAQGDALVTVEVTQAEYRQARPPRYRLSRLAEYQIALP
jgi:hypothetical protein